ncbi:M55 family metallopeptidase [Sphingosinicella rhizophila]|uniref:M55 family metallopeptidase n=1 Tax=Sphingosinicella rhizophila TaxID=3050082 RepID=A0ABU3QBG3_9SPHN|nr:M55 family metallopeptidase [Sphingosinicella sp. GR2756]MDT9600740.1 M55 family metallopeptidase [Sphingosinicella sp. GR2756]
MKDHRWLIGLIACATASFTAHAAEPDGLKVYISVDMEGVAGVVDSRQASDGNGDYERFRRVMTAEANAAIQGALDAGATEILVNDSHGSMRNLMIEDLLAPAQLISSNIKPLGMVQGLDRSFDAAVFIGYHAKAGSAEGVLAHTGSGSVRDLRVNGMSVGEGGLNAYAAGFVGVPVVLVSGDQVVVEEMRKLVPQIEGVAVKQAIGTTAARSLRPEEAQMAIRSGVARALANRKEVGPLVPKSPTRFEMELSSAALAANAEQIPMIERKDGNRIAFQSDDFHRGYRFVRFLYKMPTP